MSQQVYFEDVQEGQEIPTLTEKGTSQRLVMWAAGSGDFYQIHYDKDFAQRTGLPDRITHGALKHALLGRMLHEWVGDQGRVRRVACSIAAWTWWKRTSSATAASPRSLSRAARTSSSWRSGLRTRRGRRRRRAPPWCLCPREEARRNSRWAC